jgi:hypothetical protein
MKLTNNEIYTHAIALKEAFKDENQKLPIKVSFYLQKNKKTLLDLAQDIENTRIKIAQENGTLDESSGQYQVDTDKIELVTKELEDLFNLEQEVNIYTINIDSLSEDLLISTAQMEALMFMID